MKIIKHIVLITYLDNIKGEFNFEKALEKLKKIHSENKYQFDFKEKKTIKFIKVWIRNTLKNLIFIRY